MNDAPAKQLADLFDGGDTVMLTTIAGEGPASRPMTVAGVDGNRLSFLVDKTAEWYGAVAGESVLVHVTLSDVRHNEFASLNGRTVVSHDRGEIERLWNPAASAFFEGQDDPNLAVLHFDVMEGEYWDSPSGRLGSLIALARAALGGDEAAGDHGPIGTD
jgi:general stress protein 26